jgi:hypothetical protein
MQSLASRKFRKSSFAVLAGYFVVFFVTDYVVSRIHPAGALLWMLSSLPVLPLLICTVLFGRYLQVEKDGYKRDLAVRCLLWGTAGMVITNLFSGFLRIFGWKGQFFPFSEFFVFVLCLLAARISYRVADQVSADK